MFRRRARSKGYQSKQFVVGGNIVVNTAQAAPAFFAADQVIIGPDELFGAAAPVQASLKRVSMVGIDYYFDAFTRISAASDLLSDHMALANYQGIYKDTLDNAGVPDASGDFFLNADQVNGTVNQQLFPERILDRRQFSVIFADPASDGQLARSIGPLNPGVQAERRVRRRASINNREAIIHRVEAFMPALQTGGVAVLEYSVYGVITYRVDL